MPMRAWRFAPFTTTSGRRIADEMFVEMMAVTGMANETNRVASGYRVAIHKQFEL